MKHPKHYDTDEATSKRMANVKLKRGDGETAIAKILWHEGYRYWLNYKKLPGSPDIAIQKYHVAVFVDGEFWHGHDWESRKPKLKRNREYWIEKIEENMARDSRVDKELVAMGWTPIRFWAKDVQKDLDGCIQTIKEMIFEHQIETID
jgi:DNA mismatch endonuclease Vsr